MDTWDIHYTPEEEEEDRLITIKNDFNGDEDEYIRWEYFENWITFQDIENYIDIEELERRRVYFAESEFGTWIGVNSYDTDEITEELIYILYNYNLTETDIETLKKGEDIYFE